MKNRLIAVDDPAILELIEIALEGQDFEIIYASNGKEALDLFLENPTLVILSDLSMPEMDGRELMLKVFESGHKPVFIMLTSETDLNNAIELFKQGIHDYIIKPFKNVELINTLEKAFELSELRIINKNIQEEREIRIESQLNWNLYKESLIKRDSDKIDSNLMANINTSLFQGSGIGNLNSIVDLITATSILQEDGYLLTKDLYNLLLENVAYSKRLLSMVTDINFVINTNLPKEEISIGEINKLIEENVKEVSKYARIRGNTVVVAKNTNASNPIKIQMNKEYFKKAIQELLFNAFKFSEKESKIYILFEIIKESYQVSFLNTPDTKNKIQNNIEEKYQNIIFEPFFRISRYIYESYPTLDSGLGLCYVEKIIRNHKGSIRALNIKNYLENTDRLLVDFCIEIPFAV